MSEEKEVKSLGRFVIDIETNNLLSNMLDYSSLPYNLNSDARLWCIVVRDVDTDDVKELVSENGSSITKDDLQRILSDCSELIGHNAIKFDLLALKLFGVLDYDIGYLDQSDKLFGKEIKVTDTLVRSRLLNPDRKGGHSLGAWGKVLGDFKGDFYDFSKFTPEMLSYCIQDTKVTSLIFKKLEKEYRGYVGWKKAEKMENKLADIAVRRETYGFWFDKEKAIACVEDLTEKMQDLSNNVNPLLPPKPMTKGTLKKYTPPIKQLNKDGSVSAIMAKFAIRHDSIIEDELFIYKGMAREIPFTEPLETHEVADISDLDHVKSYLIELGWRPMEMKVRDLTKDSKKQSISYEKRVETLDRWLAQTFDEGKYKVVRLRDLDMGMKVTKEEVRKKLLPKLENDFPVRVPTSPCVRVGVEKELCPNLTKLGDKVSFANDFVLYQTYKHRKSSIAGGKLDDVDYEDEYPDTGYLSMYREEDERVSTPAIEIGAGTQRYRHISIANIPRVTSVYGEEMRSLFGCGKGMYQFGFDFSSLEARIQGHYVLPFDGEDLAASLLAEKPNDVHCYSEDTEILTNGGWKFFGDLNNEDLVAQYDNGKISFVTPLEIVWQDYSGTMLVSDKGFKVTPNHRVHYKQFSGGKERVVEARDFVPSGDKRFVVAGNKATEELHLEKDFVRFLVATQADSYLMKDCSGIRFSFTKESKLLRLKEILESLEASYTEKVFFRKGRNEYILYINSGDFCKKVRSFLGEDKSYSTRLLGLSLENLNVFVSEIGHWDGTFKKNGDVVFDSTCKKSVKFVQTVCSLVGKKCMYTEYTRNTNFGSCITCRAYISNKTKGTVSANRAFSIVDYKGKIGCVSVPSGFVLVKRENKIVVSGNTLNARKLGMDRGDAKAIAYMLIYGGSSKKAKTMLGITQEEADALVENFWEQVKPLKDLKEALTAAWEKRGKTNIVAVDGRKINIRSQHSLINFLFQSGGVICAKYSTIFLYKLLEEQGYKCNPFEHEVIDMSSMIEYHKSCGFA